MSTEEQQILNIKVRYEDAIYGILRYKEKLAELSKMQEKLKQDYKDGKITYDEYATTTMAVDEQVKSHKTTVRELSKEVQNNIKTEREQEGSLKALRAELSNATKAYDSLSAAERNGARGEELKKHINDITEELKGAEEETQRFYRSVGSYEASIKSVLGINTNFAESLMKMSDNGKGISGIFNGAAASAKAFGKTLMGLMGNPVFMALAGIAGVGMAFKWFFDYNKGIAESTMLTNEFLGLTGDGLKAVRSEIQATADAYGKDFKETLEAVDVLISQYGYDAQEALKIINDGFQSGADLNGDMIDKIKQYAPAFHDAGISGRELVATIQQTRSGIFSDSGLELIQMGSKRIREMSTATAGALDAIGISAKKVQEDLENGSKSTYDVIKMISTKLKELPQNSQEVGNVLKDVFGRQGANAGLKMIEQLDTMNTDLEKLKDTTGDYGKKLDEQREANEELNRVMSAMFEIGENGFAKMMVSAKTFIVKGITEILKGVMDIANGCIFLYNKFMLVVSGVEALIVNFKSLLNTVKSVFNMISGAVKGVGRDLKGLGEIVEGIVTLSFDKIKNGFSRIAGGLAKNFNEGWKEVKKNAKKGASDIMDSIDQTIKKRKASYIEIPVSVSGGADAGGESVPGGKGTITSWNGTKKGLGEKKEKNGISIEDMARKEEEEIRKAEDLLSKLLEQTAEQRRQQIEVQYDRQIEDLQQRLDNEKGLTVNAKKAINDQILALERLKAKELDEFDQTVNEEAIERKKMYIRNRLEAVEKGTKEEYDLKIQAIQADHTLEIEWMKKQVMDEEEKNKMIQSINEMYHEKERKAYEEFQKAMTKTLEDEINERYKLKELEAKMKGLENGEDSSLNVLELEIERKKELYRNQKQQEYETDEEYRIRKLELETDIAGDEKRLSDETQENEIGKWNNIIKASEKTREMLNAFGEDNKALAMASKAIALAEIAINTGLAISKGISGSASLPFPKNLIAITTTIAQIMSGIAMAKKAVTSAKFASGGLVIGPGSGTSDSIPARLSNGESVMTAAATSMFAPALSAFNQIGGGVPIINNIGGGYQIGEDFLARAVAKGMAFAPRPVVSVEEINRKNHRVETIERIATL